MAIRISAADLREAQRTSAAIRDAAAERGEPAPEILLDVEVVVERDVAAAFAAAGDLGPGVRYVGTPRGLAGLIADVRRLGIADGVVLVTPSREHVEDLMLAELCPGLALSA